MAENGIAGAAQDEIVQGIKSFALYGFPESHAASFALLAYASAYLKAHHPAAFLCALLNNWPMGFYHPATLVNDAVRHGVEVRPIDVTRSGWLLRRRGRRARAAARPALRRRACARRPAGGSRRRARRRRSRRWPTSRRARQPNERELATLAEVGALRGAGRDAAAGAVAGRRDRTLGARCSRAPIADDAATPRRCPR